MNRYGSITDLIALEIVVTNGTALWWKLVGSPVFFKTAVSRDPLEIERSAKILLVGAPHRDVCKVIRFYSIIGTDRQPDELGRTV